MDIFATNTNSPLDGSSGNIHNGTLTVTVGGTNVYTQTSTNSMTYTDTFFVKRGTVITASYDASYESNYTLRVTVKPLINGLVSDGSGDVEINAKSSMDVFLDNIDVDYAYDTSSGANYTVIRVYKTKLDGTKQYPFVVVPNTSKNTYSALDLMNAFADTNGYLLAINSGLGTSTINIDGIAVQNGIIIKNSPAEYHVGAMPLTIDSNGDLYYADANADANDLIANGVVSALCGFCPIIVDFKPVEPPTVSNVTHFTQNAQRQIIGQFGNGDYAIITCEGRNYNNSDGWTIAEAQTVCEKLGLKFAYNLDGGGSTQTVIGKKQINTIYENETGRKLPSFIVFNGTTELGVNPKMSV